MSDGTDPNRRIRATDNTEEAKEFKRQRRAYRRGTIFYSTLAAGFLSLFINGLFDNTQAGRSQENCKDTEEVARILGNVAQNVAEESKDPGIKERWSRYAREFRTTIPPDNPTCKQQFPKKFFVIL